MQKPCSCHTQALAGYVLQGQSSSGVTSLGGQSSDLSDQQKQTAFH